MCAYLAATAVAAEPINVVCCLAGMQHITNSQKILHQITGNDTQVTQLATNTSNISIIQRH